MASGGGRSEDRSPPFAYTAMRVTHRWCIISSTPLGRMGGIENRGLSPPANFGLALRANGGSRRAFQVARDFLDEHCAEVCQLALADAGDGAKLLQRDGQAGGDGAEGDV